MNLSGEIPVVMILTAIKYWSQNCIHV